MMRFFKQNRWSHWFLGTGKITILLSWHGLQFCASRLRSFWNLFDQTKSKKETHLRQDKTKQIQALDILLAIYHQ